MEDKSTTITIIAATPTTTAENGKKPYLNGDKNKKKRGAFTLIKAAMLMMRRRPDEKPKPVLVDQVASKGILEKVVGSIRPLHLQDNQSPPPSIHPMMPQPTVDQQPRDVSITIWTSPHWSSSCSEEGMSQYGSATNLQELDKKESESRYASAVNLQALDKDGETDDDDESDDGMNDNGGDEMIDAKADEFIAKFYMQLQVQHLQSVERYNKMHGDDKGNALRVIA